MVLKKESKLDKALNFAYQLALPAAMIYGIHRQMKGGSATYRVPKVGGGRQVGGPASTDSALSPYRQVNKILLSNMDLFRTPGMTIENCVYNKLY